LSGSLDFITKARAAKYIFGGVTHKAGLAAAAGIYALRHNVKRLADDHSNARELATGLGLIPGVRVDQPRIDTNLVYFDVADAGLTAPELAVFTQDQGVRFKPVGPTRLRAALHLGVSPEHIPRAVGAVRDAAATQSSLTGPLRGRES
jgi:threonine aldolase